MTRIQSQWWWKIVVTSAFLGSVLAGISGPAYAQAVEGLGFVWANNSTAASYQPSPTFAHNSTGGAITIARSGVGRYRVVFAGLSGSNTSGGHVQVTAYGNTDHTCKVFNWQQSPSFTVNVRCQNAQGALVDTQYDVLVILPSPATLIPPPMFTLTVDTTGNGSGTITTSPGGINCGTDCTHSYTDGTIVTLRQSARGGSVFNRWLGPDADCLGTDLEVTITMNANKTCRAEFEMIN